MTISTPSTHSSLHPCSHVEELTHHVHELADQLQQDMDEHQRRPALAAIWEMERTLTTLEYELLDGEECAEGDAS